VIFNTAYYTEVMTLLDDSTCKKPTKDPTQSMECNITLLTKESSLPEHVAEQL
jgi:hypothetical protein